MSMFTVGGNSLSGKIHLGLDTDEIIFTFQLRGNLTAPFSQLTLRWGTWRQLMTILPKLSLQSYSTLSHLTIWGARLAPSLFYSGWSLTTSHQMSLLSGVWNKHVKIGKFKGRGSWRDGKLIQTWGKTWQFRTSRVPKTIPKVWICLWASHVLGYRHFLTVSVSLLGPDLFPVVWICQQPTWKGEDQDREGEVRIEDLIFRISAPPG